MAYKRRNEYWLEEEPETYRSGGSLELRLYRGARVVQIAKVYRDKAGGQPKASKVMAIGFDELVNAGEVLDVLLAVAEEARAARPRQQSRAPARST